MAQRWLLLVTAGLACACGDMFPKEMRVEATYDDAETAAIVEMIGEVNKMGQELLGEDLIAYKGRDGDANGFDLNDLGDGVDVIYEINVRDRNYDYLQEQAVGAGGEGSVVGYGPRSDILVFAFLLPMTTPDGGFCFSPDDIREYAEDLGIDPGSVPDVQGDEIVAVTPDIRVCRPGRHTLYLPLLQNIVVHELGHYVGLGHIDDPEALMYPKANGLTSFTDKDKSFFCCNYRCITDKYVCPLN